MATNKLLTIDQITKAALAVLRNKLNFVTNMNKGYDDSFGVTGAKIGDALRIRTPAKYTVRSNATLNVQDTEEGSVTLRLSNRSGVDMEFTSKELALDINEFTDLIIEPAASAIAAKIESQVVALAATGVSGGVVTSAAAAKDFLKAGALLTQAGVPLAQRGAWVAPLVEAEIVDVLKSLNNDAKELSRQYLEGRMGKALGFDWYGNAHIPAITLPADIVGAMDADVTVDGTDEFAVTGFGNAQVIPAGALFTVVGCNAVNGQTGVDAGVLRVFTVAKTLTLDGSGEGTLEIVGDVTASGAKKNVSALPGTGAVINILGEGSAKYYQNIVANRDFIVFGTANLPLPEGVDKASNEVLDGISIRLIRDYDITTDAFPCRMDVLWGATVLRPECGVAVQTKI